MTTHIGQRFPSIAHTALRIMAGIMFFSHGGQKLFGWFGAKGPVDYFTEFGIAGVLEFVGGLAIALGLFTRPAAFIVSGEMAVAYFWKHVGGRDSLWWWANGGELAALYCFTFLLLTAIGAGAFSVDGWWGRLRARRRATT